MGLFDVHAHLTSSRFSGEVETVVERARAAGVSTIVTNGLNVRDNEKVLELAEEHDIVRPALGLYPVDAVLDAMLAAGVEYPRDDADSRSTEESLAWLRENAGRAVAIGEIGLDHHWVPEEFWQSQEETFRELIRIALDANLPAIVHTRKAERRAFEILGEAGAQRVVWHCYSSRLKFGRLIAEQGHYLSIPANARRNETFSGLLRGANRERLLLETDCPYLAPEPGQRNEPRNVQATVAYAAELWEVSPEQAQSQFEENFERLFGFRP